jgi:hypothetical protein
LGEYFGPCAGGFIAYFVSTWIFYWWHYARHEIYFLWLLCHQFHHSAQRIEVATSFYKHPVEILLDSVIMSVILYPILGFSPDSTIWLSGFSAFGEYFYHMNIKTPRWVGYFFQRPESHRIHHLRNKRVNAKNFGDIPIWDILNGTFDNPERMDAATGFDNEDDKMRWKMLCFKDVIRSNNKFNYKKIAYDTLLVLLVVVGCFSSIGFIFGMPTLRAVGTVTTMSPLPLVFSTYFRQETFATYFTLDIHTKNGSQIIIPMTRDLYEKIDGPYNKRNVYGAVFSHGPFFRAPELIDLRHQILHYGFCQKNLDIGDIDIKNMTVIIKSKTRGKENMFWEMNLLC